MAEWERVYKCRFCGKEFSDDYTFSYQKGRTCSLDEWIERGNSLTTIHKCNVKRRGIADFIGVRIKNKEVI